MSVVRFEDRRVILASKSPRRLDLMRRVGFDPVVMAGSVDEEARDDETPQAYTERLAAEKADYVVSMCAGEDRGNLPMWVLAADTVVVLDDSILEKPGSESEAVEMLMRLSGRWHTVVTSFCWRHRSDERMSVRTVSSRVYFRKLREETIARYVATGEPMDKAGAYGIQDIGATLVREVQGSYFTVVGLPVCEVVEELESLGGLREYPFSGGGVT